MLCEEVQELLIEQVTSPGDARLEIGVAEHLQRCAACRAWRMDLEQTWQQWHEDVPLVVEKKRVYSVDLVPAVMQQVKQQHQHRQEIALRTTLWQFGVAASLTFAFVQLGWFQWLGSGIFGFSVALSARLEALSDWLPLFSSSLM